MRKIIIPDLAILFAVVIVLSCSKVKAQTYRILPLGNSITQGMGAESIPESEWISYRKELFDLLSAGGYNFDFVGHLNDGYDLFSDANHGGIPGARAQNVVRLLQDGYDEVHHTQITPGEEAYLDVYPADIILLHIGTNDITNGEGPGTTDLESILDQIDVWEYESGTHVVVFIARIIRRTDKPANNTTTIQFNNNVAAMISRRGDPGIFLVNLETGADIDYDTELTADGVHPAQSAYDKMGGKWFESLDIYLSVIPDSPGGFEVRTESSSSIVLNWLDNSNNETGFEIERSLTPDGGSFNLIQTTGPGSTVFTDVGLSEDSTYYYRIRAINSLGPSLFTAIDSATTFSQAPEAPGELQASTLSDNSISLTWIDNSDTETTFSIERSEDSGTGFSEIAAVSADETYYEDWALRDGSTYYYRVFASDENQNSDYSNEASATTDLSPPTALTAISVHEDTVSLAWVDNSVSETGYSIERSEQSGTGYSEIYVSSANAISYEDSELNGREFYYYRIRAARGILFSAYSEEVRSSGGIPTSDSTFSFYPNPNKGYFTVLIQKDEDDSSEAYIRLADFSGRVHFLEEIDLSDTGQIKVVNVELPPSIGSGFYSLSLVTDKRTMSEKLVLIK